MPCICENPNCQSVCDCGERLCGQCFLDTLDDPTEKNLFSGGNFYKEDNVAPATDYVTEITD